MEHAKNIFNSKKEAHSKEYLKIKKEFWNNESKENESVNLLAIAHKQGELPLAFIAIPKLENHKLKELEHALKIIFDKKDNPFYFSVNYNYIDDIEKCFIKAKKQKNILKKFMGIFQNNEIFTKIIELAKIKEEKIKELKLLKTYYLEQNKLALSDQNLKKDELMNLIKTQKEIIQKEKYLKDLNSSFQELLDFSF